MSRAKHLWSLTTLAMLAAVFGGAPSAHAENARVIVGELSFRDAASPPGSGDSEVAIESGDSVTWDASGSNSMHTLTWENGNRQHVFHGDVYSPQVNLPPGEYTYFCELHYAQGMIGTIVVTAPPPPTTTTTTAAPTTTTTAAPTTTTTAAPTTTTTLAPTTSSTAATTATTAPPTTGTTRPPTSTTSTTRPSATTATTSSPSSVTTAGATKPASVTTTTAKKKPTTTTTKKKKTTTTKEAESTTTTMPLPSLAAAGGPPLIASGPMTLDPAPAEDQVDEDQEALGGADAGKDARRSRDTATKILIGGGALVFLLLVAGGWGWYNRSSRYQAA